MPPSPLQTPLILRKMSAEHGKSIQILSTIDDVHIFEVSSIKSSERRRNFRIKRKLPGKTCSAYSSILILKIVLLVLLISHHSIVVPFPNNSTNKHVDSCDTPQFKPVALMYHVKEYREKPHAFKPSLPSPSIICIMYHVFTHQCKYLLVTFLHLVQYSRGLVNDNEAHFELSGIRHRSNRLCAHACR